MSNTHTHEYGLLLWSIIFIYVFITTCRRLVMWSMVLLMFSPSLYKASGSLVLQALLSGGWDEKSGLRLQTDCITALSVSGIARKACTENFQQNFLTSRSFRVRSDSQNFLPPPSWSTRPLLSPSGLSHLDVIKWMSPRRRTPPAQTFLHLVCRKLNWMVVVQHISYPTPDKSVRFLFNADQNWEKWKT